MHYFISIKEPKVELEPLNVIDPDTFGPLNRLTITLDFTYPCQEDGHEDKDRYRTLTNILMNKMDDAFEFIRDKLKGLDETGRN